MKGATDRTAQFRTVISVIYDEKTYFFEGSVTGRITTEPKGEHGFGYDSVFIPDGYEETFAELSAEEKNKISHRSRALAKLRTFLLEHTR